jgi:putative ABC transport system permease protein
LGKRAGVADPGPPRRDRPFIIMFKLLWRNTWRHPLRSSLTVSGMALAVLAFCLLRTMVGVWDAAVASASPMRLVTRNAVSLMVPLPLAYYPRVKSIPHIKAVTCGQWFRGIYLDERHFFPQLAFDLPSYFEIYPEFIVPPDQKASLFQDRRGCAAGRQLAQRYGWRLGDAIVLKGTDFQGEFPFVLRAIYHGSDPTIDEGRLFFHWDYLNEMIKKVDPSRADQVAWFISQVPRPDLIGPTAAQIDAMFKNSLAETLTESEAVFRTQMVSMTSAILMSIKVVSWVVIGVILIILVNTMAMSARERRGEYAVLKTMGFQHRHLTTLIMGESILLALGGGLLGILLTFPAVQLFRILLGHYFRIFPLTRVTLALGLGAALTVGVLAAIAPAWRAARLGIAETLGRVG